MFRGLQGGGSIGCDRYKYVSNVEFEVGSRYVFFFWPIIDSDGVVRDKLMLSVGYPFAPDGTVTRPDDESIPLETLEDQIRSGTVPSPTPDLPGGPVPSESGAD